MSRIGATVRRQKANERVIEFIAIGKDVKDGSQGGLIAVAVCEDGTIDVEIYRADPAVHVTVNGVRYQAVK